MNATLSEPATNLMCQHGICITQTGWMYENLGYTSAALSMYQQAMRALTEGIASLNAAPPDDALFHLGASQLRLGCICLTQGNSKAGREWIEAALPNLCSAWMFFPGNPWYQQALTQAALILGEIGTAEKVRDQSPPSVTINQVSDWIDQAIKIWERLQGNDAEYLGMTIVGGDESFSDWSVTLLEDVFGNMPAWAKSTVA
jgi:hypothetical protein